jgi:hypothetical protein
MMGDPPIAPVLPIAMTWISVIPADSCSEVTQLRGDAEGVTHVLGAVHECAIGAFGSAVMSDLSPECVRKRTSADHSEFMGSLLKDFSEVAREELRAFTTL